MRIVISGVETNNKGAELMLFAILQEIETKYPTADVIVPWGVDIRQIKTPLRIRYSSNYNPMRVARKLRVLPLLERFGLAFPFSYLHPEKGVDLFLDANGFYFSDQWNISDQELDGWQKQLKGYRKQGTKIVFLPQAFGPVEKSNTKKIISSIGTYADIIYSREEVSDRYVKPYIKDHKKIILCTDFTASIHGIIPDKYQHLKDAVCIIPNSRMLDKGSFTLETYTQFMKMIVEAANKAGKKCYFLNHEGKGDEKLAYKCSEAVGMGTEVVTGLSALEVKGLISTSYLCISSRFHGVASALNGCVPCLATSWSHKYAELYKDYKQYDCLLDVADDNTTMSKIEQYLEPAYNENVRNQLIAVKPYILDSINNMWNKIWEI